MTDIPRTFTDLKLSLGFGNRHWPQWFLPKVSSTISSFNRMIITGNPRRLDAHAVQAQHNNRRKEKNSVSLPPPSLAHRKRQFTVRTDPYVQKMGWLSKSGKSDKTKSCLVIVLDHLFCQSRTLILDSRFFDISEARSDIYSIFGRHNFTLQLKHEVLEYSSNNRDSTRWWPTYEFCCSGWSLM